jgi:hypothetical protein
MVVATGSPRTQALLHFLQAHGRRAIKPPPALVREAAGPGGVCLLQILEWLALRAAWDSLALCVTVSRRRRALAKRAERYFDLKIRRLKIAAFDAAKVAAFGAHDRVRCTIRKTSKGCESSDGARRRMGWKCEEHPAGEGRVCATPLCGVTPSFVEYGDMEQSPNASCWSAYTSRTPNTPRTPHTPHGEAEFAGAATGTLAPPPTPLCHQLAAW